MGLPRAVAAASLLCASRQTQDSWEGATHHHLIFGDVSPRQVPLLGTTPGLGAPTSRSDTSGPAWAELHLTPLEQAGPPRTVLPRDLLPLVVISYRAVR